MDPILHLVSDPNDDLARRTIEAQKAAGIPVEVVHLDDVTDWHALVDRVLQAGQIASW